MPTKKELTRMKKVKSKKKVVPKTKAKPKSKKKPKSGGEFLLQKVVSKELAAKRPLMVRATTIGRNSVTVQQHHRVKPKQYIRIGSNTSLHFAGAVKPPFWSR